ncbi:methyl-accepting chemotaxis protein [Halobacterium salinarum]|uniref:methyl-accepting chemotaxis protein n=1 Tax=Halobacterium salinarum TaxID=2242 RepID=UPI001F2EEA3E|nr:methyl-accepting chemotaxis protein [Halobacterium salinarum]MCF2238714.1 methyl-accepting chemotaxis protein [Halobacterium salinarum]
MSKNKHELGSPFTVPLLLNTLDVPAFAVDADGAVVAWDDQIAALLETAPEDAIGVTDIGERLNDDGSRALANKVADTPIDAHHEYDGVGLADESYALLTGDYVYEDTTVAGNTDLWFIATPVYHTGEFRGVIEIVQDRSSSARYQSELQALFGELVDTLDAYDAGRFDATVDIAAEDTLLDDEYIQIGRTLTEFGDTLAAHITEVHNDVERLEAASQAVSESSAEIDELSTAQSTNVSTVATEVETLSATVQEIASTADEVVDTSATAERLADDGSAAASDAADMMADVATAADSVTSDVEALQNRIEDIDEVVDVITGIAEQTNMLALNASIEAARAGEEGEGFAVVAEEVKALAEDAQSNAGHIESLVSEIQRDTADTVTDLVTTTDRIEDAVAQVEDAMASFEEIVTAVEATAEGIEQVSDATNEQAASAEEIAAMVDETADLADDITTAVADIVSQTESQSAMLHDLDESVSELHDQ